MTETSWIAEPDKDFAKGKRQFLELYGSLAVMNTYLKIAVLCLCAVVIALVLLNIKTYNAFHQLKPLVIRISEVGRAEAITYGSFEYQPQEAEIKYFLAQFVQNYYGRAHATFKEAYPRSLYFLDSRLADAIIESNKKTKASENFLLGQTDEVDIDVKNVAIEDLRKPPYKAAVEFEKVYRSLSNRAELKRQHFIANFVFVVRMPVPNALIPVNPLGLTITYFREDQAFEEGKP
ncbi:MAG: VirB8/TrbF family protein [Bryobacteraceae bacterium]